MSKPVYSDISLNLKKHPFTGDFLIKTDVDAVKQAIRNILLTNPGEKPFDPHFGFGIQGYLFELASPASEIILRRKLQEVISQYEPRVVIESIKVGLSNDRLDSNTLNIDLFFYVKNINGLQSVNFSFERIR